MKAPTQNSRLNAVTRAFQTGKARGTLPATFAEFFETFILIESALGGFSSDTSKKCGIIFDAIVAEDPELCYDNYVYNYDLTNGFSTDVDDL